MTEAFSAGGVPTAAVDAVAAPDPAAEAVVPARAASVEPYPLYRHTLGNGLRVVVLKVPHVHALELGVFVQAGPRFEHKRDQGISHFTEHMLFKGTRNRPGTFRLHAEVERLGAPIQALTGRDHCQYAFTLPPRNLRRGLALFADIIQHPSFEGIDTERQIILEELLGDRNEAGEDLNLDNHSRALLWPESPAATPIVGTEANIRRFTPQDLFRHHSRHYTGQSMLLYFVGPVDPSEAIALAEEHFGSLPAGESLTIPRLKTLSTGPRYRFLENEDSQDHLTFSFAAPSWQAQEYPALVVLQSILVDGISSRLQWNLCERLGMVYDFDAGMEPLHDGGAFDITASVAHARLPALVSEVLRVLRSLRQDGIEAEELEKALERYRWSLEFSLDSPSTLAAWLMPMELYAPLPPLAAHQQRLLSVTLPEVNALARSLFQPSSMAVVLAGKLSKPERMALQQQVEAFGKP